MPLPSINELFKFLMDYGFFIAVNTAIGTAINGPAGGLVGAAAGTAGVTVGGNTANVVALVTNIVGNLLPYLSGGLLGEVIRYFVQRAKEMVARLAGLVIRSTSQSYSYEQNSNDRSRGPPQC